MSALVLHHLPPSPNNIKVRLALGLKKLDCELQVVNPMDRSALVELSGQSLTPLLLHEGRPVYDSYAILRYLDANFPQQPRLFSPDRDTHHTIEDWELYARCELGEVVGMIFRQAFADEKDAAVIERANALLAERLTRVEEALAKQPFLMGETPNAADITVAPFVGTAMADPSKEPNNGIMAFFAANLRLPEGLEHTPAWVGRVMAFDVI